ncbi:MAG: maleylpyruvate isomerase N-terminal domain-containing protein [Ignavibacteria bacterium]|nr:maleylpyruvate isomerase N-terminal domain-containing protein [Ignavibacteria bacterium]
MTADEKEISLNVIELIPILDDMLISFLKKLSKDDWNRQTIAKKWKVKDVAAHLLDGNIRGISFGRDKHLLEPNITISSNADLVNYLNNLNAEWVLAAKRFSPELLIEFLDNTNKAHYEYVKTLNLFGKAIFPVGWAGETESQNWFHIAREYTEKWIHQQQIRDAFDNNDLMTRDLFLPMINILMFGLPNTFKNVKANDGCTIKINIVTEIGAIWYLKLIAEKWTLLKKHSGEINSEIQIPPDIAWKLFTKSLRPDDIKSEVKFSGDLNYGNLVLEMVSVMA